MSSHDPGVTGGTTVGQCSAACYTSKGSASKCECPCGGRTHGGGATINGGRGPDPQDTMPSDTREATGPMDAHTFDSRRFPYHTEQIPDKRGQTDRLYQIAGADGPDGDPVPSATSVLGVVDKSGPLTGWATKTSLEGVAQMRAEGQDIPADYRALRQALKDRGGLPDQKRDAAGDRGTTIHQLLEDGARGRTVDSSKVSGAEAGYAQGLRSWQDATEPEFVTVEVAVASREHRYAGRFDYLRRCDSPDCRCQGRGTVLGDLKTSKVISDTHHMQLAGYRAALAEMGGPRVCSTEIVQVRPDGTHHVERGVATDGAFLAARQLHAELSGLGAARKAAKAAR